MENHKRIIEILKPNTMPLNKKLFNTELILFLLLGTLLFGQDTENLNLNQPESGLKLHEATNSITIQQGFTYTANSTDQLIAKIIPTTANSKYVFDQSLENDTLIIDTSFSVGSINGSASVGSSGAAGYTIPIDLPPGRAGISPQLSISYNSMSGDGLMGLGWGLSGFSSISRTSSDFYHDGIIDGVDFDNNDQFALDGQRLIGIGSDQYRTVNESFSKITMYGSILNPTYFKIETKEGLTLYYGNTNDSKVEAEGRVDGYAYSWKLNKVEDKSGNFYTITYAENTTEGTIYPSLLKFTGNGASQGDYAVELGYIQRSDVKVTYIHGSRICINKLLRDITIKYGDTIVSKYHMEYNESKLKEVIKYGKNNSRLNPTKIEWGIPDSGLNQEPKGRMFSGEYSGDFNGDGRLDEVIIGYGNNTLYLADNSGTLINSGTIPLPSNYSETNIFPGDYNGDGMDDILMLIKEDSLLFTTVLISNGNGFFRALHFPYGPNGRGFNLLDIFLVGDFNGDGKTDLMRKPYTGNYNCLIYSFSFSVEFIEDEIWTTHNNLITQSNVIWGNQGFTQIKSVLYNTPQNSDHWFS